jgi:hypothetical protein
MADGSFRKTSLNATAAFESISPDIWVWGVAPALEPADILALRVLNRNWLGWIAQDDVWLPKLTALSLQYPFLSMLDQAIGESVFAWFWRCVRSVGSGDALARRHRRGEYPYLKLYGTVENNSFNPFASMQFPIEWGVIVELIDIMARSGKYSDPAMDASILFENAPPGVAVDGTFRYIHAAVKKTRGGLKGGLNGDHLGDLPKQLGKLYIPRSAAAAEASSSELEPATGPTDSIRSGGNPKLMLRLKRMNNELLRANERIAQLEAENARLRTENAKLRTENRELRAELRHATGVNRQLEETLTISQEELRTAHATTTNTSAQLDAARKARAAVARKLDAMIAERDRMKLLLTAAERHFEKAQAALHRERGRVNAARDAADKAREHEAEVERDSAAQVAAAQLSASQAIEVAVEARILERGLMTKDQFVEYSTLESALGVVTPAFRRVAANVMSVECSETDATTTLPPANGSGKGRGYTYMKVVKAMKQSNELSRRQLWERTQHLKASLSLVSGGGNEAEVEQLRHFLKSNKQLVKDALEGTWLSPPKTLSLEDLIALRAETSGAMYDAVVKFIREKTGANTEATRKEVKAAFDDFKFEYETGMFTSVDDKEVEDKDGKKVMKRITTHGYYLRVKDALKVLQESAAVHAKEGRLAWPSCVPHDVYPVCVMLDAGGGSTKVVLKHPCVKRADSVRSITLLAVLTGAKDTYNAMREAFGPLLTACSNMNRNHTEVHVPWASR